MPLEPLVVSLVVGLLAEMGDKSQFLALALATRFRPLLVLAGTAVAILAVNLVSVTIGQVLGLALPTGLLTVLAGLTFIAFGVWSLKSEAMEEAVPKTSGCNAFLTVAIAFFVAELGDKTQLAAVGLAVRYQAPVQVWLGATLGMVAANGLAIALGVFLHRRLPVDLLRYIVAALFFVFGVATLVLAFI